VSFIDKDGEKYDFQVSEGDNLLDIAQANDLEMEGEFPASPCNIPIGTALTIL
jgi:hypothetical protein